MHAQSTTMTADRLATDILARQGHDTHTASVSWRQAQLTAKQAAWLYDLCHRENLTIPGRHGHREASNGLWFLTVLPNGSGVLRTYILDTTEGEPR